MEMNEKNKELEKQKELEEKEKAETEAQKLKDEQDKKRTEEEAKLRTIKFKEIRIKVKTYDNMYYTVCVLNEETIVSNDFLNKMPLDERLESVLYEALNDLYDRLMKDEFIISRFERKILNTKEVKETILQYN